MPLPKEYEKFSWQDYRSWPESERWELIDGIAWSMSPAPTTRHQALLVEMGRQFANFLIDSPCRVFVAPIDVKFSPAVEDDAPTVVQPDLLICCNETYVTDEGIMGPPDLIVEIVSPSSGIRDRREKYDLYERYGVTEYWLADPTEELVEIYRRVGTGFKRIGAFGGKDKPDTPVLPGFTLDLARCFPGRE